MLLTLLRHQLKEGLRSKVWQKNALINALMIFLFLYLLASVTIVGFAADKVLLQIFPGENPFGYINSVLLYYFLGMMLIRFYFHELPALSIQHYLHLPIKRIWLIRFLMIRSKFNLFTMLGIAFFVPIYIRMLASNYTVAEALPWLVGVLAMIGMNNFLVLYFKRMLTANWKIASITLLAYILIVVLDYYGFVSLLDASRWFFMHFLEGQQWLIAIPIMAATLFSLLLQRHLLQYTYLGSLVTSKKSRKAGTGNRFGFLSRFGAVGELLALEAKLIFRHKRTRSVFFLSVGFLLYGFFFYTQDQFIDQTLWLIFVGLLITGMFMLNYGQFIYSWESNHYDYLLSQKISPKDYVRAKFWLFVVSSTIAYLLTLPYIYFGSHLLLINTTLWIVNMGINTFIVLFFGTFSPARLDLNRSSAFNWQGVKATQFLLMFPIQLIPMLVFGLSYLLWRNDSGLWILMGLGAAGLLTSGIWINILAKRINSKKYSISAAFREG